MIFVCVSCGKKFLYRGDPAAAPACKNCGGEIRPEEPAAPAPGGDDARVKELEEKLQAKEKELQEARERLSAVESDSQEAGAQIEALQAQLSEAEDRQERVGAEREREIGQARARIAQLEKDLQSARSETSSKLQTTVVRALREKEQELQEAQASILRYGEELKKAQELYKDAIVKRDREAEEHAAATAEAQASIARLGEDLKKAQDAYKEALQRKDQELAELHNKVGSLERRLAASGKGEPSGGLEAQMGAALDDRGEELERAQTRIRSLEKNVVDADQKYAELQRRFEEIESRAAPPAEKNDVVERLQAELDDQKADAEKLRRRLTEFEMAQRAGESAQANVKEARYLAEDMGRNFMSLAATMTGLVERVRRLVECLHQPEPVIPEHVIPGSTAAIAETPPGPGMLPTGAATPVEEVPVIDSLPAPSASEAEGHLPADDTILEMGGGAVRPVQPAAEEASPVDAVPMSDAPDQGGSAEETPAAEVAVTPVEAPPEEAGQFEATPTPPPRVEAPKLPRKPPPSKKRGFFGKLFGRK